MNWQNRIVGEGEESPEQLLANPKNFRIHPKHQQDALEGVLDEVGWVQRVIVNRKTGHLVDGHLRVTLAMRKGEESIPVLYVDLDEAEESLILSTLDPISALATTDNEKLDSLLHDVQTGSAAVMEMLSNLAEGHYLPDVEGEGEQALNYSRKIEAPIYEPKGEKPAIKDLYDTSRTDGLVSEIRDCEGLTDDERLFLEAAAQRHTVLRFDRIADFYAHSRPEVQRLMENSALVIIDFDRAIELGFVTLTKQIAEITEEDHGA